MNLISQSLAAMIMICGVPSLLEADETEMQFEFHRGGVPATGVKVELAAGDSVVKDNRGLVLTLKITNAASEMIKTSLAHEWHGGEWPPTSLFASVAPEKG